MKTFNIELNKKKITFKSINSIVFIVKIKQIQTHIPIQNSSIVTYLICEQSKYSQLLSIIEELGKNIKLIYTDNRISGEKLKIDIIKVIMLIKEYLMKTEMNS